MSDIEKLGQFDMRIAVMRERMSRKARFSEKEKQKLREGITGISEGLAEILSDESLSVEFKERLSVDTRKQMVLMSKALDDLERLIKVSRDAVAE